MSRFFKLVIASLLLLAFPALAYACLWDYDTLRMERQQFPKALELITGKFLRHSPEFYRWRIQDRLKRLEQEPQNLALYDDLAVAYDKTGQQDKAIETILKKDALSPGLYETEANLGTFLIHAGKLEEGLVHIAKAIATNPDAHFGREKYQQLLVEYVLSRRQAGNAGLPLADAELSGEGSRRYVSPKANFVDFLKSKQALGTDEEAGRAAAVKGILGIMKFGNYDSPIVLEALGDLLARGPEDRAGAKQLAARAYMKASMEVKEAEAKEAYRLLAEEALRMQLSAGHGEEMSIRELETQFQAELAEAQQWYQALRESELQWIREGKNADEEFDKLYAKQPVLTAAVAYEGRGQRSVLIVAAVLAACVAIVAFFWRRRYQAKLATAS